MAPTATLDAIAAPDPLTRALAADPGVRSDAARITQVVTDALAPCMEGVAFAGEVEDAVDDLEEAITAEAYTRALDRINRLGMLAGKAKDAFRRFAARIEPRKEASR